MKSFGVPLSQAPRIKGKLIPTVVDQLITHLERTALHTEGLFRVSGSAIRIKELIAELESGKDVDLNKYESTTVAETLKRYFGELPEPIVPFMIDQQVKSLFEGGVRKGAEEIIPEMKFAVDSLSEINFSVLQRLSKLLAELISYSDKNKMSLPNVVTCIAPTMRFTPAILTYCIVHHKLFFETTPNAPSEELKIMAENSGGQAVSLTASATNQSAGRDGGPSFTKRLSLMSHSRKSSAPSTFTSSPKLSSDDMAMRDKLQLKEELLKEKQRLKEDMTKEKKQLKEEFERERQSMLDEVVREKELMKDEINREKAFLKELYSKEKRLYKDEVRKLRKELDMARTVIQALKDKIDTFAEVNYELERKLKKQQLRNKALQLDIEGLHRRIIKQNVNTDTPKLTTLTSRGSTISSSFEHEYSSQSDDSGPKRDEDTEEDVADKRRSLDDKHSKSRGKRRSVYIRSGSSSTIDGEKLMLEGTTKDKKEKTKDLLKKNTAKLMESNTATSKRRSSHSELDPDFKASV